MESGTGRDVVACCRFGCPGDGRSQGGQTRILLGQGLAGKELGQHVGFRSYGRRGGGGESVRFGDG